MRLELKFMSSSHRMEAGRLKEKILVVMEFIGATVIGGAHAKPREWPLPTAFHLHLLRIQKTDENGINDTGFLFSIDGVDHVVSDVRLSSEINRHEFLQSSETPKSH